MRRFFIIIILAFLNAFGTLAKPVILYKENVFQHGSTRAPSMVNISADYDDFVIAIMITNYIGNVHIYVTDSNGNIVLSVDNANFSNGPITIDVSALRRDTYMLHVVFGNSNYVGIFNTID